MLPKEGFSYKSKITGTKAKVTKVESEDVTYIYEGQLQTCTVGEFHSIFNLLSKEKTS